MNNENDMRELIPVSYDNPERPTVSGRELHDFLEVNTPYKQWFDRMTEYDFTEDKDYCTILCDRSDGLAGKPRTDHQLTIPMAKELCMIQRNERGKQARQYFLAIEAQWNSPEAVMRRAVLIAQKQNDQLKATNRQLLAENNDLKPDAEYARAVCIGSNCRTATEIAKDYGLSSAQKLNDILHGLRIQYKTSGGQWVLYAKYCGKATRKTASLNHSNTRALANGTQKIPQYGRKQGSVLSMSSLSPSGCCQSWTSTSKTRSRFQKPGFQSLEREKQMPDFETFLLALASIVVIIVAFGFSWAIISGLWWIICHLVGWQFTFGVPTAIWVAAMLLKWVTSHD